MSGRTYNLGDAFGRERGNALRGELLRAGNGLGTMTLVLLAFRQRWLLLRTQRRSETHATYMYSESLAFAQLRVIQPAIHFLAYDHLHGRWVEGVLDSTWEYRLEPQHGHWTRLLPPLIREQMRTPDAVRAYLALGGDA